MSEKIKIAILISGRGSNMLALIETLGAHPKADFCCVISDNPNAMGLSQAEKLGVRVHSIDYASCADKIHFESALSDCLQNYQPDLIVLAGFMRLLSAQFIAKHCPILNIHPSLLPKYPGLDTHQRALDNGDVVAGATVHWVNEVMDGGEIIAQCQLDINAGESAESLAKRLLPLEHQLYQQVIRSFLAGDLNF